MDNFQKRAQAHEALFAHKQEHTFIINANACSIFGDWLAHEKMHLSGAEAAELTRQLLVENLKHGNTALILDLATHSLEEHDIDVNPVELKKQFLAAQKQAQDEFIKSLN